MTATQLRERLIKRLAEVEDQELLALIDRMLDRSTSEDAMGASMLARAIEANEDIKVAGLVPTNDRK
jgi:hypothetical protein